MKVLFVWPGLTGYMGDCWRELAKRDGIDLKIAVDLSDKYFGGNFKSNDVLHDLNWCADLSSLIPNLPSLGAWTPDIVFTVGWHNKVCRAAVDAFPNAKKVCCFDMPWEWRLRKIAARFILWRYLRHFDAAFVSGVVAAKYARWLGFQECNIFKGLFSTDTTRFNVHIGGGGFLSLGREVPEKGIDVLKKAYELYKGNGGRWQLRAVSNASPSDVAKYYSEADCFVLPSLWEPWGVVLAEAAATGLPIICTDKCGARHEVVRDNGIVVESGDIEALVAAMQKIENMPQEERLAMGAKGKSLAQPYSCQVWADRVASICHKLTA